tara:strand:+ start:1969 stop:5142 length:3174 start_codon:yes stop_codon:yes gene_type:complete
MPGCDSGRNVQKYTGGGGGSASTLQEALENSNVASINIELINGAKYIGDGSLLTNIPGVGGSVGTLQQVTTAGDSTNKTTNFTNSVTAIKTTGNVFVGAGLYGTSNVTANIFYGDGGCLSNTAATAGIQEITNTGNATTQVVSFNHGTTSLTAASNVRVVGNVYATGFNGGGYHVTGLDAAKIDHGTLPVVRGGTGVTSSTGSGNLVLSAGPTLSGTITGGTFSGSGSGLTSLNATNISSGTLSNDRLSSKTGSGNIVMSASPTLSGTITGGTFSGSHSGDGSGLSSLNASNISSGTLSNDRLSSKTGSGNIVMSASPTLSGTITGGTFSGTHTGDGSGLSSLNAGNISSGTLSNDRLSSKTGSGNIVMSASPTLSGTITGGTFSGTHTGDGSGLSSLNAGNISSGTVPVSRGGTGTNTLNNLIAMGTHTTGDYVSTITGGDGIQSTGGTSGENIGHTLSLDLKSNHGLAIDSGELKVDLKSNGGLAFESGQLALKLDDSSITGDLGAGKGGTGITSYSTGDILYASGGTTLNKLVSNATTAGWFLKCVSGGAPQWADVSQVGSANPYAHIPGTDLTGGNYTGASAITWNVSSDASASNNSIVKRDGSGKITATSFIGSVSDFTTGTLPTGLLPVVPVNKGGTGTNTSTGTGNNVLSASPDFTGVVDFTNNSTTTNINGGKIILGDHLDGVVNTSSTSKNVYGKIIQASSASGSKLVGQLNESGTNKHVYGHTIYGENHIETPLIQGVGSGMVNFYGQIAGSNTISGDTITGSTTKGTDHIETPLIQGIGNGMVNFYGQIAGSNTITADTISGSTITASTKFSGSGADLTNIPAGQLTGSISSDRLPTVPTTKGGTGIGGNTPYSTGDMIYATSATGLGVISKAGSNASQYLKMVTDNSGNITSLGWADVASSGGNTVDLATESTDTECFPLFTNNSSGNGQAVKVNTSLKFNSNKGTLQMSNIVTSDTTSTGLNGISNTTSTHTLSVGTVVSIQETSTGDVIIVRGNGYNEGDLYVGKVLTVPRGGKIVADTINVTSLNVKESMVVAERPVRSIAI